MLWPWVRWYWQYFFMSHRFKFDSSCWRHWRKSLSYIAIKISTLEAFRGVVSWKIGGLALSLWFVSLFKRCLFKALGPWFDLWFVYSLLLSLWCALKSYLSLTSLVKQLVTRVSSCQMYFSAYCINSTRLVGGFLLNDLKNSTNVVPFCVAYTARARASSRYTICKASKLNLVAYCLKIAGFLLSWHASNESSYECIC